MGKIKEAAIDDAPLFSYHAAPESQIVRRSELAARVWQIEKLISGGRDARDEVEDKFLAYHLENPNIYQMFDHWTKIAIVEHKRTRFSHWNIFNRIRWEYAIKADDPNADFKISNDYLGLYARLWMERNPRYIDFFETKLRASERAMIERLGWRIEPA
jgi:hypothetical protein